jgi:hypothetical protein
MSYKKNGVTYGDQGLPTYGVICNRDLNFINARINQQKIPTVSVKNLINPRLSCGKNSFGKYKKTSYGNNSMWYPNQFIDLNYNSKSGGYINANGPNGPYFALGLGNYPRAMYKKLHFGMNSDRPSTPEKNIPNVYTIHQSDLGTNENALNVEVNKILSDPNTKHGDIINYVTSGQTDDVMTARIFVIGMERHKGDWRFPEEDIDYYYFGKVKRGPGRPRKSPKRSTKITYCLPKEQKFPVNTKKRCSAALSYARYAPEPCQIARCVQRHCKKYPTVGTHSKLIKDCDAKKKRKSKKKN